MKFRRIDYFWRDVGAILDEDGRPKYPQLFALAKCVMTVSHGNSIPERGFSINRNLLESHGSTIGEDTIEALRFGKSN